MSKPAYPITEQVEELLSSYAKRIAASVKDLEQNAIWAKESKDTDFQALQAEKKRCGELETDLARVRMDVDYWRARAESAERQLTALGVRPEGG